MEVPKMERVGEWAAESHLLAFLTTELSLYLYRKRRLAVLELDLICTTPRIEPGLPRGSGGHSDPTFTRAHRLAGNSEYGRLRAFCVAVDEVMADWPARVQRLLKLSLLGGGASVEEAAQTVGMDLERARRWVERAKGALSVVLTRGGCVRYMAEPRGGDDFTFDEEELCAD